MRKWYMYLLPLMLIITLNLGIHTVQAEDGETDTTEKTEESSNTNPSGESTTKDEDEEESPFKDVEIGEKRKGVNDKGIGYNPSIRYGMNTIAYRVYEGLRIATVLGSLLVIVWISLQTLILSIRSYTDGGYNAQKGIGKLIVGNIEMGDLKKRIVINIGVIVIALILVFGGLSITIQQQVYKILDGILSYIL